MDRMGHCSTHAALIYAHGGDQRQRAIADTVSDMARKALREQPEHRTGFSEVARNWHAIASAVRQLAPTGARPGPVTWCSVVSRLSESNR